MLPELLQDVSLFRALHLIDQDLARRTRQSGCPYCHGPLHLAPYQRKPRGGPPNIPEEYQVRLSLCCGSSHCRRRVLPPSVLFFGRKVYWGAIVLIVTMMHQRKSASINRLAAMFSVSRATVVRWLRYFRTDFPASDTWHRLQGLLPFPTGERDLPISLFEHLLHGAKSPAKALVKCLFLVVGAHAS